ncbi:F-box protein SKIP24 [Striga hermonthica]|uniref:F-box protein SKIP24 n=1 Tax=Striga hermonthica TaxID=68872 RepID=A0A9N7ML47_STRHE|nr:F-box protein SKIP24 [Striga hermonthica]
MSALPDELWTKIMEIGINGRTLDYKNLCCLSITCRRLRRLAADDALWSLLLLSDYPSSGGDSSSSNRDVKSSSRTSPSAVNGKFKNIYKISYEKDRERKRLAHRRAVLRIESQIAEHSRKIQEIKVGTSDEKEKMNKAIVELSNLRKIRQASVALNVWQPEIIRGRQKEMVQQINVPVDIRINALEMEINLCKQQIAGFDKALKVEKRRLRTAREELGSVKYHPLREFGSSTDQLDLRRIRNKKSKHSSTGTS